MKKKISRSTILQVAIWTSILNIFLFAGDSTDKLPMYYLVTTLRMLGHIVFFNVVYQALLPLYFLGRKKVFYWFTPVAFAVYIGLSILNDLTIGRHENLMKQPPELATMPKRERPLAFVLIPPIFLSLVLFGAAATFRGFAAFENKKQAEEEANRRRLEAEIALLKSQINPHFLVNTLNNLYALSLTEPEKTPGALLKLSEMVGYILYECAKPKVALSSDVEFIENYIALQRLRLPPNVSLTVDLPANLPNDLEIEPMILIPFIENAFKHGLTTRQSCELFISMQVTGQRLTLQVQNPLLPPKPAESGNPSGIGMANTQQRLEHSYPGKHTLQIENDGQHYRVHLYINLKK